MRALLRDECVNARSLREHPQFLAGVTLPLPTGYIETTGPRRNTLK
jgi:hypothetical protein